MYPFLFEPVYKEKIWGGDALARLYGRKLPSAKVGESWEIAAHPHGQSRVRNGEFAGRELGELVVEYRDEIMGDTPMGGSGQFPLLVKLLDCNDWLSIQVHPDDDYARVHENGELGKTETWVVLHAQPGAQIVYGVKPGTTREAFAAAVEDGSVEGLLQKVTVRPGEVYTVPAGTLHALGRGVVVAEIQQNSDTVYRVYDWGRVGPDGRPRELHVEKALDVIDFARTAPEFTSGCGPVHDVSGRRGTCRRRFLAANAEFAVEKLELSGQWIPQPEMRCLIFMVLSGSIEMTGGGESLTLRPGDSVLVPAAVQDLALAGSGTLLRSYVPQLDRDVVEPLAALGEHPEVVRTFSSLR